MIFNTLKTVLNSSDSFSMKLQPLIIFLRLEKSSSFGSNKVSLCEAKLNRVNNKSSVCLSFLKSWKKFEFLSYNAMRLGRNSNSYLIIP